MHQILDKEEQIIENKEEEPKHIFRPIFSTSSPDSKDFPNITLCGRRQKPQGVMIGIEAARNYVTCQDCRQKLESYKRK